MKNVYFTFLLIQIILTFTSFLVLHIVISLKSYLEQSYKTCGPGNSTMQVHINRAGFYNEVLKLPQNVSSVFKTARTERFIENFTMIALVISIKKQ